MMVFASAPAGAAAARAVAASAATGFPGVFTGVPSPWLVRWSVRFASAREGQPARGLALDAAGLRPGGDRDAVLAGLQRAPAGGVELHQEGLALAGGQPVGHGADRLALALDLGRERQHAAGDLVGGADGLELDVRGALDDVGLVAGERGRGRAGPPGGDGARVGP